MISVQYDFISKSNFVSEVLFLLMSDFFRCIKLRRLAMLLRKLTWQLQSNFNLLV